MSNKRIIKSSIGVVVALFVILVIHIILVTKPKQFDNQFLQLAKIDVADDVANNGINTIMENIKSTDGVKSVKYFDNSRSVVVSYDNRSIDNTKLEQIIKNKTALPISIVKPSASAIAAGCPIKNKDSFMYKFSMFIRNIFY